MSRVSSVKCDRCGKVETVKEREDAEPTLPEGWRQLVWQRPDCRFADPAPDLCETCVEVVKDAVMRAKP